MEKKNRQKFFFNFVNLYFFQVLCCVVQDELEEQVVVRVLDCDTISQVKAKVRGTSPIHNGTLYHMILSYCTALYCTMQGCKISLKIFFSLNLEK